MIYNELTERGTEDFPIGFYHLDKTHPKYIMQHHWHREIEIVRIISGALAVTLNNKEIEAYAQDIIFVNSEVVHGAVPKSKDCVYECVVFDPQKVILNSDNGQKLAQGLVNHTLFLFHRIKPEKAQTHSAANSLFDAFSYPREYRQISVIGKIYELFAAICMEKIFTDNSSYANFLKDKNLIKLKHSIEFIRENYKSQLSLEDISDAVGVSPKYFCVIFKSMTGMTAFEYLNTYRIEKACKALISTDLPITEIAFSHGFNDLSYFIKTFKKHKSVTPKHFRNANYS